MRFHNMGQQRLTAPCVFTPCPQAAARTNDLAGDGTTTATVLSAAFIAEGMKIVSAGGCWRTTKGRCVACASDIRTLNQYQAHCQHLLQHSCYDLALA